jgi:hypothetical protein
VANATPIAKVGWLVGCGSADLPAPAPAPEPSASPASVADAEPPESEHPWIPANARTWGRSDTVEHDFDGDGRTDIAVVLTDDGADRQEVDRLLVVALADGDGFRRVLETPCIALCQRCGGVFGDPYEGMTQVGERSLKVGNYGGSSWRWSSSYTLAWRDEAMAVVGYDSSSFHTSKPEDVEEVSLNLLNGRATKNGAVMRHEQGKVAADDCDAVQKLGSIELE